MSRSTRRLLLAAALLLTIPSAAFAQKKSAEPSYDGKPLKYWIGELKASAPQSRNVAAYAISGMGAQGKPAVPALVAALSNKDEVNTVRYPILVALREIGPEAKEAIPAIEPFLDDRNEEISAMARKAIKAITGTDPRPPED
ncbi:MAG TPA: HEAT repeat domain-containing protein [Gemmatimonadales bacterium]|nr:HEAT repeat domain-containing protein [Gemmatimonadales bacterium]